MLGPVTPLDLLTLAALFGKPSSRFVNSACGSRYTEIAWGHLYVEFRDGRFSGYRCIENGWPANHYGVEPHPASSRACRRRNGSGDGARRVPLRSATWLSCRHERASVMVAKVLRIVL